MIRRERGEKVEVEKETLVVQALWGALWYGRYVHVFGQDELAGWRPGKDHQSEAYRDSEAIRTSRVMDRHVRVW